MHIHLAFCVNFFFHWKFQMWDSYGHLQWKFWSMANVCIKSCKIKIWRLSEWSSGHKLNKGMLMMARNACSKEEIGKPSEISLILTTPYKLAYYAHPPPCLTNSREAKPFQKAINAPSSSPTLSQALHLRSHWPPCPQRSLSSNLCWRASLLHQPLTSISKIVLAKLILTFTTMLVRKGKMYCQHE